MTELAKDVAIDVAELMTRYGFDLGGYSLMPLVDYWLQQYPVLWLRSAVVEALYQGRYKAISVEQILNLWQRRGMPLYHFNGEFERIVCTRLIKGAEPVEQRKVEELHPSQPLMERSSTQTESVSTLIHSVTETLQPSQPEMLAFTNIGRIKLRSADSFFTKPATRVFKPAASGVSSSADHRSSGSARQFPIDQFTPIAEQSDFYQRLKAVAGARSRSR